MEQVEEITRVEWERRRVMALDAVEALETSVREFERQEIARVIELCKGNHQEAAIRLGIGAATLYRKLRRKA